ncbi:MAG: 16S rRNA (adenine(1518)-N(6)/adenine(1519)-N(6))-dimethyltransferase [Acidiferrobacteraceae bacterium]|nr:16S rRNA (adenine(1518)-N(6)/adenine(1519)-N(6))-dimethyltransferase [Acidiferrobacteraceae bacterium]|tara:strand:- start:1546 stop:2358 length:813 start_codon:yes stop_codon:yes gene_type:complete
MPNSTQPAPHPRKRFGQHFLRDKNIIRRIVDSVILERGQALVEIGPGRGALTSLLAEKSSRLHAIEVDRDLACALSEQHKNSDHVTVHAADALKFDYRSIAQGERQKIVIVGNLPYNISTPLFFVFNANIDIVAEMVFMVQREIASRLTAAPCDKNYGRLTVTVGRCFEVQHLFDVGPAAFSPAPKVKSTVIRFVPRTIPIGSEVSPPLFEKVVRDVFSQRRKTLRNALKNYEAEPILAELGIDPMIRGERLSIEQFTKIVANIEANLSN